MNVADARGAQSGAQGFAIVLRIMARAGNRSNIDHAFYATRPEQLDQFLETSSRMANGENWFLHGSWMLRHASAIHDMATGSDQRAIPVAQNFASALAPERG